MGEQMGTLNILSLWIQSCLLRRWDWGGFQEGPGAVPEKALGFLGFNCMSLFRISQPGGLNTSISSSFSITRSRLLSVSIA